jgi:hypothetical protein
MFCSDLFIFISSFVALGTVLQGKAGVFCSRIAKQITRRNRHVLRGRGVEDEKVITDTGANFN